MKYGISCRYTQVEHCPGLKDQDELTQQQEGDGNNWGCVCKFELNLNSWSTTLFTVCTDLKNCTVTTVGFCLCLVFARVLPSWEWGDQSSRCRTGSSGGNADSTQQHSAAQELVRVSLLSWSKAAMKSGCQTHSSLS